MSKFHNTVSRRDFMKGLGLAGAGLGAAAATTPVFHDVDELTSSAMDTFKRGWWVKEREYGNPTIEIDWSLMKRRDLRGFSNWDYGSLMMAYPGGPPAFNQNHAKQIEAVTTKSKEVWPDYAGPTTRDIALSASFWANAYSHAGYCANLNQFGMQSSIPAPRPSELNIPVWQGTPEENTAMLRAVFSLVGLGPAVGTSVLDEKTENFMWEYTGVGWTGGGPGDGNKRVVLDPDISESYKDSTSFHIPTSQKYVIATHNMSCDGFLRRSLAGAGFSSTEEMSYARVAYAKSIVEHFIRGLGYNVTFGHDLQSAVAWDIWSGVGEHCRMGQVTGSPEYGGLMRTHAIFYTDMPLTQSNPVDAGITKFCETCGICAETCPVGAIPERGINRSWENNCGQSWADDKQEGGTQVMYNVPGYEGWRCNLFACAFTPCASACKSNCPFNAISDGSFIHSVVKSTVANTPILNSFFTSMEEVMHYGKQDKDPESWWNSPEEWFIYGAHPNLLKQ
nr:reductive dehalogenase [uncultured bacterium]UZH91617.1 reductive dehalogenase [uncultured bacterium]